MSPNQRDAIGPLPLGRGLLGLIIREARSYRIPNIAAHPDSSGFPANHPPMTSFLGVPVTSRGRWVGNLYRTDRPPKARQHERRAAAIGATLRVESAEGKGTRIIVVLPSRADA
jgi:GAF domain-containing protein